MNKRLDAAAWSAARFSEIYDQLKKMDGEEAEKDLAVSLLQRETGILLRRIFMLWVYFKIRV